MFFSVNFQKLWVCLFRCKNKVFKGWSDIFSNLGAIKINQGELTLGPKVTQTGFQVTQQTGSAVESDEEWTRETGSKNKNDLLQRIDSETGNLTKKQVKYPPSWIPELFVLRVCAVDDSQLLPHQVSAHCLWNWLNYSHCAVSPRLAVAAILNWNKSRS